jgi:large repetitive protein
MGNGIHVMTTKAMDVAGNVSAASTALSITIDATAPARPALPDLLATSDTGVSSTDNITKITTPSLAGTAEALSTVTVYDGTTVLGTTAATALGTWSLTPTLGDGTHSITVKATDAAGNVSAASSALALTIDTTAPSVPAFSGGNATTLRGTGDAGDTVTILNGGAAVGTATVGSAGNWSWSFIAGSSPLAFTALQTDKAGNVGSATVGSALIGTSSNNTLISTGGNDLLVGAGGTDTFSFSGAFGKDIITDLPRPAQPTTSSNC